jgi:hypothetical protein
MTKQILLGHKACDVITGFEGIAFMTGNRQLSLQPRMKEDGTMPLPQSLDISVLEYVGEGEVARRVEPEDTSHIVLGSAAQDIVTKVEGILLHRYTFLNGCVYFSIQPAIKNKDDREIFVEWKRIKVTSAGVRKDIAKNENKAFIATVTTNAPTVRPTTTTNPPGGPSASSFVRR